MQDTAVRETRVEPGRAARPRLSPWLLVLLPFLVLALLRVREGPGIFADDAGQYLMHARALVEGRSYTDIEYIYSPRNPWIGPRAAPPGLPITLAVIWKTIGPNMMVMKAVMLVFATAFLLLSGLYFAREDDRRLGYAVALLCSLSPVIVYGSSQLLTDLPFAALTWSVIYLIDSSENLTWRRVAAITLLGGLALAFRTAGLALIPALLAYAAFNYRRVGLRPVLPIAIWSACLVILAKGVGVQGSAALVIHPERVLRWIAFTRFGTRNLHPYSLALFESLLYPFAGRANDVYHAVAVIVMLTGLVVWLRKSFRRFAGLFFLAYAGLLLIAPISQPRYIWVLFPFFLYGLLNGVAWLAGFIRRQPKQVAVALIFAILMAPLAIVKVLAEPRQIELMQTREVREVVAFLERTRGTESLRVTFYKPRSFAYATQIPTMGPIAASKPCLLAELRARDITHVIFGRLLQQGTETGTYGRLAVARPDLFTQEFQNAKFTIYRFHSELAPPWDQLERECESAPRG